MTVVGAAAVAADASVPASETVAEVAGGGRAAPAVDGVANTRGEMPDVARLLTNAVNPRDVLLLDAVIPAGGAGVCCTGRLCCIGRV